MKRNTLIIYSLIGLFLSSCSMMKESTATDLRVISEIHQYPTVTDLNVLQKVDTAISWNYTPFNFGQPSLNNRETNLVADIIKSNGADVLLEKQIVYTKVPYGARTLTITGYPAKFKDFRKATKEDLEALRAIAPIQVQKKAVYQVSESNSFFAKMKKRFSKK